jgi:hypothetical protein
VFTHHLPLPSTEKPTLMGIFISSMAKTLSFIINRGKSLFASSNNIENEIEVCFPTISPLPSRGGPLMVDFFLSVSLVPIIV